MKYILIILSAMSLLAACSKINPGDSELNGMTFLRDENSTIEKYEFQRSGNVYHYRRVGATFPYDTKGCSLYYTLDGEELIIYYGAKGWDKLVRHSVYSSGSYHGDYIIINGNTLYRQ